MTLRPVSPAGESLLHFSTRDLCVSEIALSESPFENLEATDA
jgi:hypothetical protein